MKRARNCPDCHHVHGGGYCAEVCPACLREGEGLTDRATVNHDRRTAERFARDFVPAGHVATHTVAASLDHPVTARYYGRGREAEYYTALESWAPRETLRGPLTT